MKLEEHIRRTEELHGIRGEDIHKWIDGFFDSVAFDRLLTTGTVPDFDPFDHRKFRHCIEALDEAYEKFEGRYKRQEIKKVFETHIKDDYDGYLPSREDFENGTFTERYHDLEDKPKDEKILSYEELTDYFKGRSYSRSKNESGNKDGSFAVRLVVPTVIAMILFIGSIFIFVLPVFETGMLNQKKLMLKELTATAISIANHYSSLEKQGKLTREEAEAATVDEIKKMRYGSQNKNYFFIIDMQPTMIMHPYRPELDGKDLSNYTDRENKSGIKLFVEFVKIVEDDGEGYLRYYWQWKDNPDRAEPKLSYVKGVPERDWIIGTGEYINDIDEELEALENKIFVIFGIITAGLLVLTGYILLQSRKIENNRRRAEAGLHEAKDRYRALVEASNEGYLLETDGRIIYSNRTLQKMLGYSEEEIRQDNILDLIFPDIDINKQVRRHLKAILDNTEEPAEFEAVAVSASNNQIDIILSTSRIFLSEKNGHIISFRPITRKSYVGLTDSRYLPEDYRPIHADLIEEIKSGERIGHVVRTMNKLPNIIREMIDIGTKPETLRRVIGSTYDEVIERCIVLSIDMLGKPPAPFAFLSLGSNARHEMTMFSDQDNALIFADRENDDTDKLRSYFLRLSGKICEMLNDSGYDYCPGGIMAMNPKWCLSEKEWQKKINRGISKPDPDVFLDFNVFLDIRRTYGDADLAESLHAYIDTAIENNPRFIDFYAQNALGYKPPLNVFGGLKTETRDGEGKINLKDALRPIEIFSRIYALYNKIHDANTVVRLKKINEAGVISEDFLKETIYVFDRLWHLRFFNQIVEHTDLRKVNDDLSISELNELEVEHLKQVISKISMLRRKISLDFLGSVGQEL